MNTLFLLFVLTQNGAGDINASFVNTQTIEQCQQKALMLESVFTTSNIPVLESDCIDSTLQFSEFDHASYSSEITNFYLFHIVGEKVRIMRVPDWYSCMEQQRNGVSSGKVYCASSIQSLL